MLRLRSITPKAIMLAALLSSSKAASYTNGDVGVVGHNETDVTLFTSSLYRIIAPPTIELIDHPKFATAFRNGEFWEELFAICVWTNDAASASAHVEFSSASAMVHGGGDNEFVLAASGPSSATRPPIKYQLAFDAATPLRFVDTENVGQRGVGRSQAFPPGRIANAETTTCYDGSNQWVSLKISLSEALKMIPGAVYRDTLSMTLTAF